MHLTRIFLKGTTAGAIRNSLMIALCFFSVAAYSQCGQSDAEPVSLASVALILLDGVQSGIGVSESMEAYWISSEKQWDDILASVPALMLEILPEPATGRPDVDYSKYGVLLIRMGEKPNGGYRLALMSEYAQIENREARIQVHYSEPEPDGIYTQAFVYPHLVIKMEKGAFDRIAVVDQNGSVILRISI